MLPTKRRDDKSAPRWVSLILPAVFAIFAAWHLFLAVYLRRCDDDALRRRTQETAAYAASRLAEYINLRIGILEHLRDDWLLFRAPTASEYAEHALRIQDAVRGFQAINWIDPDGVIRWIVPEQGNIEARDLDLRNHPTVASVVRRAGETGTTQVGPPVDLAQGGRGFTVYVPIPGGEGLEGYVNGVFRSSSAIAACLDPEMRRNFHIAIRGGGAPLYRDGDPVTERSSRLAAAIPVRIGSTDWDLELAPSAALMKAANRTMNHILAAQGMLLVAGLSGLLALVTVRERRLAASERRYRLLVEHVEDGIVISQNDRFIYLNPRFAAMLGYSSDELRLKTYKEIYTPRSLEILEARRRRRESGEQVPSRYETVFQRKDGTTIDVEASVAIIHYEGRHATFGVIRDVTERKRADARLRRREHYLACLTEITADLLAARLPEALMPGILERLREVADVDRVYLHANRRAETGDIVSAREFEARGPCGIPSDGFPAGPEISWRLEGLDGWADLLAQGQPISRQTEDLSPAERTAWRADHVKSVLLLPMDVFGEWQGFLGFDACRGPRRWDDQDIQFLRTAAATISGAMERSVADQEARILAQLATRLAGATSLEDVVQAAREESDRLFQWDAYFLAAVRNEETFQMLDQVDTVGGARRVIPPHPWTTGRQGGNVRRLLDGKGVLINRDGGADDPPLERFGDEDRASASLIQVPVRSGGSIVGILSVQSYTPQRYRERDLRGLQRVADTVASALERGLMEQVRIRLAAALEQVAESVIITDKRGVIEYVNPAFERSSGYGRAEAVGRSPGFVKGGRHPAAMYARLWETILGGGVWTGRFVNRRKDGTLYHEEATISPVRDGSGNIVNFVGVKRDITKEIAIEAQLRHGQKMEAVGTLAGGIAHDFNNLLTGILGYASLLASAPDDPSQVAEAAAVIERAAQQAADLTRQLLGFARGGKHRNVPIDIHGAIVEVIDLLKHTIGKNIRLDRRFGAAAARALGDPGQMQQILLNLALNARDAMPLGGRILFHTSIVDRDERVSPAGETSPAGRYIRIRVKDTGSGIPEADLERIFEPFFTTKEHGRGTGMGLAMVYGIVRNHGGFVEVASTVGRGSAFDVYLPVHAEAPSQEPPPAPRRMNPRGSGSILLVDDEELVRDVAGRMLSTLGYRVVTASDGREAVETYRVAEGRFDLVILDMIMPDIDGWECFRNLKKIDPDVRAILSTGCGMDGTAQRILDEGMLAFVQKPYRASDLARVAASVLGSGEHNDGTGPTGLAPAAVSTPCTTRRR